MTGISVALVGKASRKLWSIRLSCSGRWSAFRQNIAPAAAGDSVLAVLFQFRLALAAGILDMRAAARKHATGRQAGGARRLAGDRDGAALRAVEARHRGEQGAGIGMARHREDVISRGKLDNSAE